MPHFDLIAIGGGSGGIATVNRAASHGARCALIEKHLLGGTCVNVGCVPKKIMWHASHVASQIRDAAGFGFDITVTDHSWSRLIANRNQYIRNIHRAYDKYLAKNHVTRISGQAQFIAPNMINVNGEQYSADHIVIASGGQPFIPDIPGKEFGITSDDFFALDTQPQKVAILGAGYIAVELAGLLHGLGSETTLIVRKQRPLRSFDEDIVGVLQNIMAEQQLTLLTEHTPTELIKNTNGSIDICFTDDRRLFGFDCVIWAVGREANTQGLQLNAAGVAVDSRGFVITDKYQQTNVKGIYAVGDITGKAALTPVAIAAARRLATRLFTHESDLHLDYSNIPTVIFSHPPIATIGLSEAEAVAQYGADHIQVYTSAFRPMYTVVAQHPQSSMIKLVTLAGSEKIIGCHMIGLGAEEILQGFAVAITMGATKADFDNTIAIHPSSAEELVTMT